MLLKNLFFISILLSTKIVFASHGAHEEPHHAENHSGFLGTYYERAAAFWEKVDKLAKADQENEFLHHRVNELEAENTKLKLELGVREESKRAKRLSEEALAEAGHPAARTEASLVPELSNPDTPPEILSMSPKKILKYSMTALEKSEFDRAARGFIFLATGSENKIYSTAQTHYLAGLCLMELKNFGKARKYLTRAHQLSHASGRSPASVESQNYGPKALGALILSYEKSGLKNEAKQTLDKLVNEYPFSAEAKRYRSGRAH